MKIYSYNPSTREVEAGESEVQNQPGKNETQKRRGEGSMSREEGSKEGKMIRLKTKANMVAREHSSEL